MLRQIRDILLWLRRRLTPPACYAVDIGVVAGGAGYAAELLPGNRRVRVKSVWFSKPSAQVTLRLIKASTVSAGGTSTLGTSVPYGAEDENASASVKLFTGAPTAGTAIGDVFEMVVATTDNVEVRFGEHGEQPLELALNQALGVNVSAAATIVGRIVFEEVAS